MNTKKTAKAGWHSLSVLKKLMYKIAEVQQKLLNGQISGHLLY